ncbi:hypothetical protein ZIOFF_026297 [Zingiber officinale]|uniref:R13L1/DRL21-like LRR repeat region domain-containing protein n=1 Tax=Zingiber officinale TaxID=94328 RepID=A0A8J5H3U6_ZINOF|nr:hypothetical protein ZIOFF_026297 [Zingiber officinale]
MMQPNKEEEDDNGGGYDSKDDEEADGDDKDDEGYESEEAEEDEEKVWSEEQISKVERICNEMAQPSSTLVYLNFYEYPGLQFPSWMTSSSLAESFPNSAYLKLVGLPGCTEFPPSGTLPQLKYLSLESASAITSIRSQFLTSSAFSKLEVETEQLPKWLRGFIEQHNNTASTHRSLRKFEMQCNLQLLKSCLKGNENWDIIKQIPDLAFFNCTGEGVIGMVLIAFASFYIWLRKNPMAYLNMQQDGILSEKQVNLSKRISEEQLMDGRFEVVPNQAETTDE